MSSVGDGSSDLEKREECCLSTVNASGRETADDGEFINTEVSRQTGRLRFIMTYGLFEAKSVRQTLLNTEILTLVVAGS